MLNPVQNGTNAKSSMASSNKNDPIPQTHRIQEHELLQRLENLCKTRGLEFPREAWPKDDHKAYFLLGVCATEDMPKLSLRERLEQLDYWARQRNLLKPNETLFARKRAEGPRSNTSASAPLPGNRGSGAECYRGQSPIASSVRVGYEVDRSCCGLCFCLTSRHAISIASINRQCGCKIHRCVRSG
jgi:hypothetical protein